MTLCYDFQKWTIVSMLGVLAACLVSMVSLVYGQEPLVMQKVHELANLANNNADMLHTFTMVLSQCNYELENRDFSHLAECYNLFKTFNAMMQILQDSTRNDSAKIMGFTR
jgi:hypothetical protein